MAHSPGKVNWTSFANFQQELERVLLVKIALQTINCQQGTIFSFLKPQQATAIKCLLQGKDVVALLPTGFGKSLIFELLPYLSQQLLVLIVSPLNSLITQQLQKLAPLACRVGDFTENCAFRVVVDHPENFLQKSFLVILRSLALQCPVILVVDEAHCVVTWGKSFRKKYEELIHLKAMAPNALTLALTATATLETTVEIQRKLGIRSAVVIKGNADRPNIKLVVRQRLPNSCQDGVRGSYSAIFLPLLDQLAAQQDMFPKTIIYTPLNWCGQGMEQALRSRRDGSASPIEHLVAQYHKPASDQAKHKAAKAFETGQARLLFATEAYSMGTDVADIRQVIHAGPPMSLETLYQGIGRAGRDGAPAEAILYYNAADIGPNVLHMSEAVRLYCTTPKCRRETLADYFGFHPKERATAHGCCDICTEKCQCSDCNHNSGTNASPAPKPPVYAALTLYFQSEGDEQLSVELASLLVLCKTLEDVTSCLQAHAIDPDYRQNIVLIMKHFKSVTV